MWPHLWLAHLWKSSNDVSFYGNEAGKLSWTQLWRYLLVSLLFINSISLSITLAKSYQELTGLWQASLAELHQRFPEDQVLSWDSPEQGLALKPTATLAVPWPQALTTVSEPYQDIVISLPTTLAYIDTNVEMVAEIETTSAPAALLLVSKHELGTKNVWNQSIDTLPLRDFFADDTKKGFEISRTVVDSELSNWERNGQRLLQLLLPILGVFILVFSLVLKSFSILIDSFIILFFGRLIMPSLRWKTTAMLAFHIGVLAELVDQLAVHLYPAAAGDVFSISFWIILAYVVWRNQAELFPTTQRR